jgi:hypothetical protein
VLPIANQDAMGLPLYAGRPVRITGERKGDAIVVAKVEAIPSHLHIGHVMTNWRDTPGTRGFLPVAIDEARVAVLHAGLAAKSATLDDIRCTPVTRCTRSIPRSSRRALALDTA